MGHVRHTCICEWVLVEIVIGLVNSTQALLLLGGVVSDHLHPHMHQLALQMQPLNTTHH